MTLSTNKLSEKAMLVQITINGTSGKRKDKKVTREIVTAIHAHSDAGDWWTRLIPKSEIDPITSAGMKCRNTLNKFTLPWMDGGLRILPSARFTEYSKAIRTDIEAYFIAVDNFLKHYPRIVSDAKERLGDFLDGQSLPTLSEMRGKFDLRQSILPLPTINKDFRIGLSDEETSEIQNTIEESINSALSNTMKDVWGQLTKLVEHVEKTLKDPNKKFKNSLISNLTEFCELLPTLNLTNDAELEDIRNEISKKLTNLQPDVLRDNKTERKVATKKAKTLLNKIKQYQSK